MYFVDMNRLNSKLNFYDQKLSLYREFECKTEYDKLALERLAHVLIESILDIGNMMIDGFVMRDPGSYADIISILVDEKVLKEEEEEAYQSIIHIRRNLISDYETVNHMSIQEILDKNYRIYEQFSRKVRHYLAEETGVANTFTDS
ncbi:Uncharacterized conserved protein YutE, UPF0331/DUF86 family [Gracilibacillus ureilyticus]|uniref:Uncharacterized conserved protein YutE, UPF0331/DUF86 family n=1 Tax=Gracilibacillus ureilyticus TaxID=531814 RepID=A0A1H9S0F8_9BACI|nr:DUF86 domain-containing protein [Gracilibacillus ureilyticus]SER78520.1 Uncharacterized conserved protein YutE, UPF0331/DUF86 family [Gracilibacillus ureilyticus]